MKILLGVGALVIIVAGAFGIFGKKLIKHPSDSQKQNQINNEGKINNNLNGQYSINELITMNKPMKCSWKEKTTEDKTVTNIIYISGKKMYEDVTMGDLGHSFVVSDGSYVYIWNDFNKSATKIKMADIETDFKQNKSDNEVKIALTQKKDFVCEKWIIDNSVFVPPKDKEFKDMTDQMNKAFQGSAEENLNSAKQKMCDLCKKAPTQEMIDKCLKNAQCN
jgi:hypothetical protein